MYMKTKMTEQVLYKPCFVGQMSAGNTSVQTSVGIDRLNAHTAYFVLSGVAGTAANSSALTFTLYQTDVSTGTYTQVTSATISGAISTTFTFSLTPVSDATTANALAIDLTGLNRFIKAYVSVTAAITNTITLSVACILGDYNVEPAS